jgi:DNA-formamidopyrimidine glycosylase
MPELPEVEVTRRGIAGPLLGAVVLAARVGKPLRWPLGVRPQALAGCRVGEVARRGKYLWLPLQATTAVRGGLLLHLGMSGSLGWWPQAGEPGPHDHFDLVTDRGTLRLNDPRRFGAVVWSAALDQAPAAPLLARLGAEPFDPALTPQSFHAELRRGARRSRACCWRATWWSAPATSTPAKPLFQAGIHPALAANRISRPRAERLLAALRADAGAGARRGRLHAARLSDAHGVAGAFQAEAAVYGRQGAALPALRRAGATACVQAQRSTYFCAPVRGGKGPPEAVNSSAEIAPAAALACPIDAAWPFRTPDHAQHDRPQPRRARHWRDALGRHVVQLGRALTEQELLDDSDAAVLLALRERLSSDKLVLAFVAEFSRGKSELINAIFFADAGRRVLPATPGRTTMCPVELRYEADMPPRLALLPIETRLRGLSLSELRTREELWQMVPLEPRNPVALSQALSAVTRVQRVDLQQAAALGFWDESQPDDNPPLGTDGKVEVPAWRHAVINYPHPLLERGLVVIDTPGLNAIGAEPELTLGLLPSAHAVVFVLAADTGVTRPT